jgi:hypothetical protein
VALQSKQQHKYLGRKAARWDHCRESVRLPIESGVERITSQNHAGNTTVSWADPTTGRPTKIPEMPIYIQSSNGSQILKTGKEAQSEIDLAMNATTAPPKNIVIVDDHKQGRKMWQLTGNSAMTIRAGERWDGSREMGFRVRVGTSQKRSGDEIASDLQAQSEGEFWPVTTQFTLHKDDGPPREMLTSPYQTDTLQVKNRVLVLHERDGVSQLESSAASR